MKNKSIIVFQGYNLGTFKFKKNFGIKEEVNIEPFRPLSHDKRIQEKDINDKETETEKIVFNKENRNKNIKIKKEEKEKQRLKKTEEARKKLIYDNRYLFEKKEAIDKIYIKKRNRRNPSGRNIPTKINKNRRRKKFRFDETFSSKKEQIC